MDTLKCFDTLDIRVGRIKEIYKTEGLKKKAYYLSLDFGPLGVKRSVAALCACYTPADLEGKLVVAVVNFHPKQIGKYISEVLILGVDKKPGEVVLITPDQKLSPGAKIY